jgi:hypothetical protein
MKPVSFLVLFALRGQCTRIKLWAVVFLFAVTAAPTLCNNKPVQECKVTFGVVYLDKLNNTNNGIPQKDVKDVEKKLSKFGDVRYAADQKPDLIFFIHTTPAVYHGTRVYTDNSTSAAAVTDGNGNSAAAAASSSTTTAVPYTVDYSVFILDIEIPQPDGSFKILRTLDQKGLYNTLYGIGYGKGKHPLPSVIVAAAQWLHDNNLGK